MTVLRLARARELETLREVERAAGRLFASAGMRDVAEGEPRSLAELERGRAAGRLFVAEVAGRAVGFALLEEVDGLPHLEELSVHPEHGRRGLGGRLLELVCAWAARHAPAITLSTFRELAWNGPFYARHGFRVLEEHELTAGLRELRRREAAEGLDVAARVLMRRELRLP